MKAHPESADGGGDDLGTPLGGAFVSASGDDSRAAMPWAGGADANPQAGGSGDIGRELECLGPSVWWVQCSREQARGCYPPGRQEWVFF